MPMSIHFYHYHQPVHFASTRAQRDQAFQKQTKIIPDARYIKVSQKGPDQDTFITQTTSAIVWDSDTSQFMHRIESFSHFVQDSPDQFSAKEEKVFETNTLWEDGVFVDVKNKRLILPNGCFIDGPTGEMFNVHGNPFSSIQPQQSKEL
jgi:hypothetical protein